MSDIEKHCIEFYKILPEFSAEKDSQQYIEKLVLEKLLELFKNEITQRMDKKYFSKKSDTLLPDSICIYGIKGYILSEEEMIALLKDVADKARGEA